MRGRGAATLGAILALAGAIVLGVPDRVSCEEAGAPKTDLSIAVAPFERVGRVGPDVPDVAMMLARRLSTLGVQRVVSPRELGATPAAEPEAATLTELASRAGVQAVVVGRTTALGSRLSIDARLHAGDSGAPIGTPFFVEVPKLRDLPVAVQDLAQKVLQQTASVDLPAVAAATPVAPPEAAPPTAAAPPRAAARRERRGAGAQGGASQPRAGFRDDAPISIHSDVLDVFERGGQKRFVFAGHVRAVQGDLEIVSDRLEAFYPPGRSQPHKIVATGNVSMKQSGRNAVCEKATFYRDDDRVVCTGTIAEVEQGCDIVRGREIIFHTRSEQLKVNGAADVRINAEGQCGQENEG